MSDPLSPPGGASIANLLSTLLQVVESTEAGMNLLERIPAYTRASGLELFPVEEFEARRVVETYYDKGCTDFLPVGADPEIERALREGKNVLLTGRPGIGKSHAAVHHIKRSMPGWTVIQPSMAALAWDRKFPIKRRRYVLLLDDLENYLEIDRKAGTGRLEFVDRIRARSEELVIVATIRSTSPEFDMLGPYSKLLSRWMLIQLLDWSSEQGRELANRSGASLEAWDGTPLSVKRPSREMQAKFVRLGVEARLLYVMLQGFAALGVRSAPLPALQNLWQARGLPQKGMELSEAISGLERMGFLARSGPEITAYRTHLESIPKAEVEVPSVSELTAALAAGRAARELVVIASTLEGRGEPGLAESALRAGLETGSPEAELYLGIHLARQGRWGESENHLRSVVRQHPDWPAGFRWLSMVLRNLGRADDAKRASTRAWRLDQFDIVISRCALADSLRESGRLEEALDELRAVRAEAGPRAEISYGLGRVYAALRSWERARAEFAEALALEPGWAHAHLGLAGPLQELGLTAQAFEETEQAIRLQPALREAHVTRGYLAAKLHREARMPSPRKTLEESLRRFGQEARLHSFLGQVQAQDGDREAAIQSYRYAVRLDPSYPQAWKNLAVLLRESARAGGPESIRNLEEATLANLKAIECDPELADAHFGLGLCYNDAGRTRDAEESLREAIRLRPQFPAARNRLANLLERQERWEEAIEEQRRVSVTRGWAARAHLRIGVLFARLGRRGDSLQALEAAESSGCEPATLLETTSKEECFAWPVGSPGAERLATLRARWASDSPPGALGVPEGG